PARQDHHHSGRRGCVASGESHSSRHRGRARGEDTRMASRARQDGGRGSGQIIKACLQSKKEAAAMTAIQSVRPPPERHADRVVAGMLRQLAVDHARLWETIAKIAANSSDGTPKAQRKMEERIKRTGVLTTDLLPGKRGRYTLLIYDLSGYDPQR